MTSDQDNKLKRKRGRPTAKAAPSQPATSYQGPSLDDIMRMAETQVQVSFDELGVAPHPFFWKEDDDQLNVALWHNYGMAMTDVERDKTAPKDKAGMQALKATATAIHQASLRTELLAAHLRHWIDSLSDSQLIAEVERLSETKMSESEKRYSKVSYLRQRVSELAWSELVKQSKLYVPVQSPL